MTVAFVHGLPETSEVWRPLRDVLDRDSTVVELPGLGSSRPPGFTATKDAYAAWLADALSRLEHPVDVVGHDVGALLTMRVASAFAVPIRSWVVDVADIFHPRSEWSARIRDLQTPGLGEEMLRAMREADAEDAQSTSSRLVAAGVPPALARKIGTAHDDVMSRSILDFYRSAVPNVAADWWGDVSGSTLSRGLVLLLPDPPEIEAMAREVAECLGVETARLEGLNHCWMAEAPDVVAPVLERLWASLE